MQRLRTLLAQVIDAEQDHQVRTATESLEYVLRILHNTPREDLLRIADPAVSAARHGLLDLLAVSFQAIERQFILRSNEDLQLLEGLDTPSPWQIFAIALEVLKFCLGVALPEGVSPTAPKSDFVRLATTFLRLIVVCVLLVHIYVN